MNKTVIVTGAAGFIGAAVSRRLLSTGDRVIGVDNLNGYYSVDLKRARLETLVGHPSFEFSQLDVSDSTQINDLFQTHRPTHVIHLAAQAGVRHSLTHPETYMQSNLVGFFNVLECSRRMNVEHFVYASSSSVYGTPGEEGAFTETYRADQPISFYAATKRSNELLAYSYSHNHQLPATGLRFFTVYGPYGRPDMAYFNFLDRHFMKQPIVVYRDEADGKELQRDFTFIDDIVDGIAAITPQSPRGGVPHAIFNIGHGKPTSLNAFIAELETCLSRSLGHQVEFSKVYEQLKTGDVPTTFASTERFEKATGFRPETPIEQGLQRFTDWYVDYYHKR